MAKKILITDVTLRDAHQSLIATRMTTEEMLPILEKMDKVGFYSLECWGGATFDACLRFLNEDRGTDSAPFGRNAPIPSCKCCSEARICWLPPLCRRVLEYSSRSLWPTVSISSVFLTL